MAKLFFVLRIIDSGERGRFAGQRDGSCSHRLQLAYFSRNRDAYFSIIILYTMLFAWYISIVVRKITGNEERRTRKCFLE